VPTAYVAPRNEGDQRLMRNGRLDDDASCQLARFWPRPDRLRACCCWPFRQAQTSFVAAPERWQRRNQTEFEADSSLPLARRHPLRERRLSGAQFWNLKVADGSRRGIHRRDQIAGERMALSTLRVMSLAP
jgi:hypothetical protein